MDPAVAQRWYALLNQHNAQIVHDATQRQSLGFDHSGDIYVHIVITLAMMTQSDWRPIVVFFL